MKDIKGMDIDEMGREMREYPCDCSRNYAFISYSHRDKDKVYPLVLSWMREGYNIYIDLDFERHGSDSSWVGQMEEILSNRLCRLAVCFGSVHYTYSYAALLELLTIRGKQVKVRHGGKLAVDYYVIGEIPVSDDIEEKWQPEYEQYFNQLKKNMGGTLMGQSRKEQESLRDGLDYWLNHEGSEVEALKGDTAGEWMVYLNDAYKAGYMNFFPMVAGLVKNWFLSQELNGNRYSLDTERQIQEGRFSSQRVTKLERIVAESVAQEPDGIGPQTIESGESEVQAMEGRDAEPQAIEGNGAEAQAIESHDAEHQSVEGSGAEAQAIQKQETEMQAIQKPKTEMQAVQRQEAAGSREEQDNEDGLLCALREAYGPDAEFRDGQEEAIRGILNGKRTLVVQKTGWGKSLVYFLATKMLRKRSDAVTLIISPLLVLINNQIESANRLGLKVMSINSENGDEWEEVYTAVRERSVDALIISPERLANEEFGELLKGDRPMDIGLFVVDEAHCISDWGHDFRPDYRRIIEIIRRLPSNIPVLATTATANDRVVNDIKSQLGDDILISRGSMMRESLAIQMIRLDTKEERLAWLAKYIHALSGTGIIYCLTIRDCMLVYKWLAANGVACDYYHSKAGEPDASEKKSKKEKEEAKRQKKAETVAKFMGNQIKVLVATVAFGMGFDKPDIGFVVHFQKPGNIVAYYQQIGRAGRAMDLACAILLCGEEDDAINEYFIDTAFPTDDLMNDVINTLIENPGLTLTGFGNLINMRPGKLKQCIDYLLINGDIYKEMENRAFHYYKSLNPWNVDLAKSEEITEIRRSELQQINEFTKISGCYMEYIARALDDPQAKGCGKCANCRGNMLVSDEVSTEEVAAAQQFIRADFNVITPRKKWPAGIRVDDRNMIAEEMQCGEGRVLSNYGDAGWGRLVADGKYKYKRFDDQLLNASCALLRDYVREKEIKWVTNISSLRRPDLVRDFARKLAAGLGLEYRDVIRKSADARCQKELHTSSLQYQNVWDSFEVEAALPGNVLLVDDMVDSGWTFTVCGYKLRQKKSGKVYPFALANSSGGNGEE